VTGDAVIAWEDSHGRLWQGDVRACLAAMEPESVQCVVTSPPYWSLRAYGTTPQVWGNHNGCEHDWLSESRVLQKGTISEKQSTHVGNNGAGFMVTGQTCRRCSAWRGELGSEPLHDCAGWATGAPCGACFICHLVEVFTAVKRVLRPDGVVLCNLGDSYAGSGKGPTGHNGIGDQERRQGFSTSKGARIGSQHGESGHTSGVTPPPGLKAKDLVGIPWRFALAMQAAGWWLRSEITWCKTSAMPESVTDRPTNATEKIFLFAKSDRYFYDVDAVRQPQVTAGKRHEGRSGYRDGHDTAYGFGHRETEPERRQSPQLLGARPRAVRGRPLRRIPLRDPPPRHPGRHLRARRLCCVRRAVAAGGGAGAIRARARTPAP
jgi:DNA modification methylase